MAGSANQQKTRLLRAYQMVCSMCVSNGCSRVAKSTGGVGRPRGTWRIGRLPVHVRRGGRSSGCLLATRLATLRGCLLLLLHLARLLLLVAGLMRNALGGCMELQRQQVWAEGRLWLLLLGGCRVHRDLRLRLGLGLLHVQQLQLLLVRNGLLQLLLLLVVLVVMLSLQPVVCLLCRCQLQPSTSAAAHQK